MGKPISIGQSHNLMSVLANNADWSVIDADSAQQIIDDPRRAGKNFTEFLKQVARLPRALRHLKLIADGIVIATEAFTKDSFFVKDGPVKLLFGDDFTKWVLSAIPEIIEVFQGKLSKFQLTEYTYDSVILGELGNPKPFTPGESVAIICNLLTKQPNGEDGTLSNSENSNNFYVQLEDRVVAVHADWHSRDRKWFLDAHDLGNGGWDDGRRVFSRSHA